MNLYQQELMDHYRHPRNRGELERPDFSSDQHNPSCGDSIGMAGMVRADALARVVFSGKGCVISQATASMLTEYCIGKKLATVLALDKAFVVTMIGIDLGPTRLKCALLPLEALQQGIQKYSS